MNEYNVQEIYEWLTFNKEKEIDKTELIKSTLELVDYTRRLFALIESICRETTDLPLTKLIYDELVLLKDIVIRKIKYDITRLPDNDYGRECKEEYEKEIMEFEDLIALRKEHK